MAEETYGRYELVEKVGQGGMAVVYRAFDPVLSRTVALKLLHPHLAERLDSRARFSREARAVARLKHGHIVEVFDYAAPESDRSYIVTEFIEGPTLKAFIEEHPVTVPEVAALLILPICEALAKAHIGGIIHRDVKPENIMLRADGSPVLMDFGIAQMVDMPTLTATGTMLGSPAHMAPEVIDGTDIGAPADIFSIGTTLYLLVTGSLPFTAPNPSALFRRILETRFDPVLQRKSVAGRTFAGVIEGCLTQDASLRPTARELCSQLKEVLRAAEIVDINTELGTLSRDPGVYQESLRKRLIPLLTTTAEGLIAEERTAPALDALDRVLSYDKSYEPALDLLSKLERQRRLADRLRHLALFACGVIPICFGVWFYLSNTPPTPERPIVIAIPDSSVAKAVRTTPLDARVSDPLTDIGLPESDSAVDVEPDIRSGNEPDATTTRRRRRPRRRQAQRPSPEREDAGQTRPQPPPPQMVPVRFGSRFKNARVVVDGRDMGKIALMQMSPIKLAVGVRNVVMTNEPFCKPETRQLRVEPGKNNLKVKYSCKQPNDARVIVRTRTPGLKLKVRRAKDKYELGVTNKVISIPMTDVDKDERLTVGAGNQYSEITVKLVAGRRTAQTVKH